MVSITTIRLLLLVVLIKLKTGRAWSKRELRNKSWEDIHALWWLCCKERNRIATEMKERERLKAGGGDSEGRMRDLEVHSLHLRYLEPTLTFYHTGSEDHESY